MRILILLLMGIIPDLVLSQPLSRVSLPAAHPYDTLQKYSYLIVTMRKERGSQQPVPSGTGTGFFIRQSKKLYLISARHVLTNCDPYPVKIRDDTTVAIDVPYRDTLGRAKHQILPLPESKLHPSCKSAFVCPDVDTMDVSDYFKDAQINTVDGLSPDYESGHELSPNDTVIAFGYSNFPGNPNALESYADLAPVGYISYSREMPNDQGIGNSELNIAYYAIKPGLPSGVSGAPVFRISRGGTGDRSMVEFSGIQSSAKKSKKVGYIVKGAMLVQLYQLK